MECLEDATKKGGELVQFSTVLWPTPPSPMSASTHSGPKHTDIPAGIGSFKLDTEITGMAADSLKSLEVRDDEDASRRSTDATNRDGPKVHSIQTLTPDLNQLTKDLQLQEEERLLLAKIHHMTDETPPVCGTRRLKLLIPDADKVKLVHDSQDLDVTCSSTLLMPINELLHSHKGGEDL